MPRRKEFDPDEALDAALCLFWEKGYNATSIDDLVERMGINRFSIYDTFGSKHALFLAAIDRYRSEYAAPLRANLEDGCTGVEAIKSYFRAMEADLSRAEGRIGCLVQNSTLELALRDPEVEERVQDTNLSFQDAIHGALIRAQEGGEIEACDDLRKRARFLFAVAQGMIVVGKAHGEAKMVHDISDCACSLIESWRS